MDILFSRCRRIFPAFFFFFFLTFHQSTFSIYIYSLFPQHSSLSVSLSLSLSDRSTDISLLSPIRPFMYLPLPSSLSHSPSLYFSFYFPSPLCLSKLEFKVTQTSFSFNLLLLTFLFAECVFSRLDGPVSFAAKLGIKLFT